MPERQVVIRLDERDIQAVEQSVLDRDAQAALEFVEKIVKPRVHEVLKRGHCKPVFEWGSGTGPPLSAPPGRE